MEELGLAFVENLSCWSELSIDRIRTSLIIVCVVGIRWIPLSLDTDSAFVRLRFCRITRAKDLR